MISETEGQLVWIGVQLFVAVGKVKLYIFHRIFQISRGNYIKIRGTGGSVCLVKL